MIGKYSGNLEVQFSANNTVRIFATAHPHQLINLVQVEALRSSLHELEGLLKEYSPLMSGSTEKSVDRAFKYGAVFTGVSSRTSIKDEQEIDTC